MREMTKLRGEMESLKKALREITTSEHPDQIGSTEATVLE
jgi:hypothetical protein